MPSEQRAFDEKMAVGGSTDSSSWTVSSPLVLPVSASRATRPGSSGMPASASASWYPLSRLAVVAIPTLSPMKATRRWPCPSRWAVASRAPARSSSITLSALIPRGGRSTKTTGVRESQGLRYDWSEEIGVAIRPASRLPSRASRPGALVRAVVVPEAGDDDGAPALPRHRLDAVRQRREERVRDVRDGHPDRVVAPTPEGPGQGVRYVLQLGDRAFDAEPHLIGDVAVVPQHARDRLGADSRHGGDLTHGAHRRPSHTVRCPAVGDKSAPICHR